MEFSITLKIHTRKVVSSIWQLKNFKDLLHIRIQLYDRNVDMIPGSTLEKQIILFYSADESEMLEEVNVAFKNAARVNRYIDFSEDYADIFFETMPESVIDKDVELLYVNTERKQDGRL